VIKKGPSCGVGRLVKLVVCEEKWIRGWNSGIVEPRGNLLFTKCLLNSLCLVNIHQTGKKAEFPHDIGHTITNLKIVFIGFVKLST
jgi:hypothetical protein